MKKINLNITKAAQNKLLNLISKIVDYEPIVTIFWSEEGVGTKLANDGSEVSKVITPCWNVGFHDSQKVPGEWVIEISGIKFVFDQGLISRKLHNKTLDVKNDNFYILY